MSHNADANLKIQSIKTRIHVTPKPSAPSGVGGARGRRECDEVVSVASVVASYKVALALSEVALALNDCGQIGDALDALPSSDRLVSTLLASPRWLRSIHAVAPLSVFCEKKAGRQNRGIWKKSLMGRLDLV